MELLEFLRTFDESFKSRSRLASLYSDFRYQRNTNPDGYQANASAWLRALSKAAKEGLIPSQSTGSSSRLAVHTGEALLEALQTPEYGRPLALGAVIQDAVAKGELITLRHFLESPQSIYHKSWIPTPWQALQWGLRQIGLAGGSGGEDKLVAGDFVIKANVESAANNVIDQISREATSNTSRLFSKELFAKQYVGEMSQTDIDVLLRHLRRDKRAIAYHEKSGTIRIGDPSETGITETDVDIASLRTLLATLEPQVQQLMARVSELDTKARESVVAKNTLAAKTALWQKKLASDNLQRRTATLAQLEEVYAKIEQAADQVEMVRVLEASSKALKTLNAQTGGIDKVSDVMDDLREQMQDTEEIGQAMTDTSMVDEGEVDAEFEALESIEREKNQEAERREKAKQEEVEQKKADEEAEVTRKRLAELDEVGRKAETPVQANESAGVPAAHESEAMEQ